MGRYWKVENFCQEAPDGGLEYVSGQEVFKNLFYTCIPSRELEEWLCLPRTWCFLLSGESGTGKTYLAKAFAAEMAQHGYRFLLMDGLDFTGETQQETFERIEAVIRALSAEERCFLMIQGLDRIQSSEAAVLLAKGIERLKDGDFPVVVTALTEDQNSILPALRRLFYVCRLSLPDEAARTEYFKNSWADSFLAGKPKFSVQQMAEITEGMNYMQLELIRMCVTGVMWKQGSRLLKTAEAFQEAVKSGSLQLSEKRFRQIAAAVRRGGALPDDPDGAKRNADTQNLAGMAAMKELASLLQDIPGNPGLKGAEKTTVIEDDEIPAPTW